MAKRSALEIPAREIPAPGGGEVSRTPVEGWPETGAHEERPACRGEAPDAVAEEYGPEDFPGCYSFHLPERDLESYERRIEFWDGRTQTAWKARESTSTQHERPSRRLVETATWVEMLRGSRITCLGSSGLVRHDAMGRKHWLMQADEVLYLHPERIRMARQWIDVEADPLPDVALEVDHSTDVRRRKLGIYKDSGLPEIWVLVPWESSLRTPGLAIHARGEQGYAQASESRAFPGWKADEIFRALTEEPWSAGTVRALERVALAMGAREGTRPEDDHTMRTLIARAREEGRRVGYRRHRAGLSRAVRSTRSSGR